MIMNRKTMGMTKMKIIERQEWLPEGIKITLTPEFIDILSRDPYEAMHVIDALEKFDKEEWREAMHLFAISGIQRTYDSIRAGEKLQRCAGKEKKK